MNKEDIYFQAMRTRDSRFDGKFFVGVKTTGIYCRPICPAKPKKENIEFFNNQKEAEDAGYRPCLRCRPHMESVLSEKSDKSALVQRILKFLLNFDELEFKEEIFASQFKLTARHLRRLIVNEIGKTPKQILLENRLNSAKKLIGETHLSITDIAFTVGFSSLRRFNEVFKLRFKMSPSAIRRNKTIEDEGIKILLPYKLPYDFDGILHSYQNHRMGNLEWFKDNTMLRFVHFNDKVGKIQIKNDPENSSIQLSIDFPDPLFIYPIILKVRALFDLDSDPICVKNTLEKDFEVKKILEKYPGIRIPTGWDSFEVAISTILGQLVSIERGRALVADLIEIAGRDSGLSIDGCSVKLFPTPKQIIESDLTSLKTTSIRKNTLVEFSRAVLDKRISLVSAQDVSDFTKKILSIKGIGPWTAQYMALKVLHDVDMFPTKDLILARTLDLHPKEVIEKMTPWRGYVAALFWRNYAHALKKTKKKIIK